MTEDIAFDYSHYDFRTEMPYHMKMDPGLSRQIVEKISQKKQEPKWMRDFRLKALDIFLQKPTPQWGVDLSAMDFNTYLYYADPTGNKTRSWDDVPDNIKDTFDRLGIPEAEKKYLGGVTTQFESETVYHNVRQHLEDQGVIFLDTDTAVQQHPEIFKQHFGTVIPPDDNKFAALNSAVWSGGSFIYVPEGVTVDLPLQAYFRINEQNMGQFERTLIIAEPNSEVRYIEGCSAPVYATSALHSAVVEIIAKENAKVNYTTIQNWSSDVYNLVTKRSHAYAHADVTWVDGNMGAKATMKYPSIYLLGEGASGEVLSMAYASEGQHQDTGAKAVHMAPRTTSKITSKSVSREGGRCSYRGWLKIYPGAKHATSSVTCDALLLDEDSQTDTYPYVEIDEDESTIAHEATVGKIGEEKLFYLMSRGIPEAEAMSMIIFGFIKDFTKELPMEYAVEINKLIQMQMEDSVG